ncbi:MAG: MFS transporter [Hyphomicrobiales bacterium]|nr:MAG: MFS transporter [Hyphomicrobiales bacterium]
MTVPAKISASAHQNRWPAAAALFLATFMNLLDVSIVNLALPSIRADLNATSTQLEWVLVVYVLSFAAGLLPFGRFGDAFGRERMFQWGIIGFMLASMLCGVAQNIEMLIASRALQGLAGAMMVPQVLAIIHVIFPAQEKGRVIGLFGMVSALGAVAGPLIGGALVSANVAGLEWRPIFFINLPLGILSLIGVMRFVPKIRTDQRVAPDWAGACLFALAVTCLTFPLVEGRHLGWPVWCFALIFLSAILFALFLKLQNRRAANAKAQLLPMSLMKDRAFTMGLLVVTLFFSGIAGVMFMLALFLQTGFGFTPLSAGLATVPHPVGVMIASLVTARFGSKWLDWRVSVGALVLFIGMAVLQYVVGHADETLAAPDFIPPLLIIGLGMGTAIVALFQSVLSRVSGPDAGAGSGVLQAFQQTGIAIGIAVTGQIFFHIVEQTSDQAGYIAAAKTALWYPIGVFLLLAIALALIARKP